MARHRVSVEGDSNNPVDRLFVPERPNGSAVLFVHGFSSNGRSNEQYAKKVAPRGITGLTFDLPGHGSRADNNPDASVDTHLEKAAAAYDFLASQPGIDRERIGVAGMSFGGYLALLLSDVRPVKSLLLRSPPMYPDRLRGMPRSAYTNEEALAPVREPDNTALIALSKFGGRVTLVTADSDEEVVSAVTDGYQEVGHDVEEKILPNTGHRLTAEAQELFKPLVVAWAESL